MKIVLLYSGGLDSRIMAHYAKVKYPDAEVKCVYYAHGGPAEQKEIEVLPSFVEVRRVDWLGGDKKPVAKLSDPTAGAIYIPGRNMVFVTLAACQELPDEIWLGALADEQHVNATDKNNEFCDQASDVLSYVLSPFVGYVHVLAPLARERWTKYGSLKWALENGLSAEEVLDTVSCYSGNRVPCGNCRPCFKRALSFANLGLKETYIDAGPLYNEYGNKTALEYMNMPAKKRNSDEREVVSMLHKLLDKEPYLPVFENGVKESLNKEYFQ